MWPFYLLQAHLSGKWILLDKISNNINCCDYIIWERALWFIFWGSQKEIKIFFFCFIDLFIYSFVFLRVIPILVAFKWLYQPLYPQQKHHKQPSIVSVWLWSSLVFMQKPGSLLWCCFCIFGVLKGILEWAMCQPQPPCTCLAVFFLRPVVLSQLVMLLWCAAARESGAVCTS